MVTYDALLVLVPLQEAKQLLPTRCQQLGRLMSDTSKRSTTQFNMRSNAQEGDDESPLLRTRRNLLSDSQTTYPCSLWIQSTKAQSDRRTLYSQTLNGRMLLRVVNIDIKWSRTKRYPCEIFNFGRLPTRHMELAGLLGTINRK